MALELRTGCATSAGACGLRRVTDKKRKENGEPLGAAAIRFAADPGVIYNGPPRRGRGRPGGTVLRWPGGAARGAGVRRAAPGRLALCARADHDARGRPGS